MATLNRSPRFQCWYSPCHDRLPLSNPFAEKVWGVLASGFCSSDFAAAMDAKRFSGSAAIVIGDSAIAARAAARKHALTSIAAPTAGISGVRKAV